MTSYEKNKAIIYLLLELKSLIIIIIICS